MIFKDMGCHLWCPVALLKEWGTACDALVILICTPELNAESLSVVIF